VAELQQQHPEASLEVWAQDEARLGLIPILRRVWGPRGERSWASVQPRYQWLYLFALVCPQTGEAFFLLLPTVSAAIMSLVLALFAQQVGAGPDRHILVVLDGAGWHVAKDLKVPEGVHLAVLPPYSPEINPAERLWPLVREALANRWFDGLEALEDATARRCNELSAQPEVVRAHCLPSWWPPTHPCESV
jgi:transposase